MGSILYVLSIVGCNTYFIDTKMGARIHRTVALLRVCEWIQLWNLSAWVMLHIVFFGYIFYQHNVVGGNTYWIYTKMGGGI